MWQARSHASPEVTRNFDGGMGVRVCLFIDPESAGRSRPPPRLGAARH